ncbi:peroxisomal biogenesis factor 11 [Dactylonectria macrodidyma]|uniref:Peroxisomal biogenesis factor 11 n=1 Tax=Dactylonectria macrodidyma TaxID=307937 RepID=A0A9P9IM36_9HYPO|nr:peroxisomal biogenesis factor 11 [Dactylonectria macrodidyma]
MVSRVILHPSVSHFVRFMSTILGRDKLMRLLQYYSRLRIWQLVELNDAAIPKQQWTRFMRQLVLARKLLRVGRGVEYIQTATEAITKDTMTSDDDSFLHHISVLRQVLLAAYLAFDNATILDIQAARFWLGTVLCGLTTQIYCLHQLTQWVKTCKCADDKRHMSCKRIASKLQLISGLCDLGISSSAAGLTHLDDMAIGFCDIVSSLIGVYGQLKVTSQV